MRIDRRYIVSIIIATIFIGMFVRYLYRAPKRHYCDFRVYYATAQRFIDKEDIYARPDESITPFKYSPMFAMLVSSLSFFSQKAASLIFFTINFILLVVICMFSERLIVDDKISFKKKILLYVLPIIFTSRFILQVLDSGQVNIMIFALVILGLYYFEKKKDIVGAAFIGLSVMFKYMPVVFIPYFLLRKKLRIVGFILVFIILYCLIPAAYVGVDREIEYVKNWLPFITKTSLDEGSWYDYKNQSLYSFVLRYFTAASFYRVSVANLTFRQGLLVAFIIGAIIYSLIIFPQRRYNIHSPIDYSLLFICMALFNPNAWMANFVIFIFVYMTILYYLLKFNFKDRFTSVLVFLSFALASWGSESLVGNNLENLLEELSSVTMAALVLLFILFRLKFKKALALYRK